MKRKGGRRLQEERKKVPTGHKDTFFDRRAQRKGQEKSQLDDTGRRSKNGENRADSQRNETMKEKTVAEARNGRKETQKRFISEFSAHREGSGPDLYHQLPS